MRALILIGLSVLFVVSCATPEKYDARLNGWLGKTETQLVQKWGKPSAMKILDNGDKVITYTKADDVYVPSQFYIYNPGQVPTRFIRLLTANTILARIMSWSVIR